MNKFTLPKDGGLLVNGLPNGVKHTYERIPAHIYGDEGIASERLADKIVEAINANNDATMEKRLYAVKASLLATLYENSKPLYVSQWSYKAEFKTACDNAGITMWSETQTITDKFGS